MKAHRGRLRALVVSVMAACLATVIAAPAQAAIVCETISIGDGRRVLVYVCVDETTGAVELDANVSSGGQTLTHARVWRGGIEEGGFDSAVCVLSTCAAFSRGTNESGDIETTVCVTSDITGDLLEECVTI